MSQKLSHAVDTVYIQWTGNETEIDEYSIGMAYGNFNTVQKAVMPLQHYIVIVHMPTNVLLQYIVVWGYA